MPRNNPTHSSRLARQISERSGVPYAKALAMVKSKMEQGVLPGNLTADNLAHLAEELTNEARSFKSESAPQTQPAATAPEKAPLKNSFRLPPEHRYVISLQDYLKNEEGPLLVLDFESTKALAGLDDKWVRVDGITENRFEPFDGLDGDEKTSIILKMMRGKEDKSAIRQVLSEQFFLQEAARSLEVEAPLLFNDFADSMLIIGPSQQKRLLSKIVSRQRELGVPEGDQLTTSDFMSIFSQRSEYVKAASAVGLALKGAASSSSGKKMLASKGREGVKLDFSQNIRINLSAKPKDLEILVAEAVLRQAFKAGEVKDRIMIADRDGKWAKLTRQLMLANPDGPRVTYIGTFGKGAEKIQPLFS